MRGIICYRKGLLITAVYTVVMTGMLLFSFRFATENGADYLQSTGAMADVLDIDFIWPRVAFVGMFLLAGAAFGVGVFNMWIRFAVLGIDDVAFPSKREAVFAAIINFIKVVALWICALIIAVIMLVVLYLVSGLEQNQLIDDCISAVFVCVAGAIFADTLVKTALVRDVGGIGPKQAVRFAAMLWLLWAGKYILMQLLLEFMSLFWLSVAFLPLDIIFFALTAAMFGYRQVWRLRVFIGEDHDEIPVERSDGA